MTNTILSALVNGAILSSGVAIVLWILFRLASRRALNAATRYAVWWIALVLAVVLPAVYLLGPYSRIGKTVNPVSSHAPRSAPSLNEDKNRESIGDVDVLPNSIPFVPASLGRGTSLLPSFPLRITAGPWLVLPLAAWLLATLFLLTRLIWSYASLAARCARATEASETLRQCANSWIAHSGTRRRLRVALSHEIETPVAIGFRQSSILIPTAYLKEFSETELDQIGLHESSHLSRRDDLTLLIQRVIEALLPWHPAVRWIAVQLNLEREIACDDFVVQTTGSSRSYASFLTRVAELGSLSDVEFVAPTVIGRRSDLARRINAILDGRRNTRTQLFRLRFAILTLLLACLAITAGGARGLVAFAGKPLPIPPPPASTTATSEALVAAQEPAPTPQVSPTPAVDSQPRQPAERHLVNLDATVLDSKGGRIDNLKLEDFQVFENGKEREISSFSADPQIPISLGILIDRSGSMRHTLQLELELTRSFAVAAAPDDELMIVTFGSTVDVPQRFTKDRSEIEKAIRGMRTAGDTAQLDAISVGLSEMKNAANSRKALILLTDGYDTRSRLVPAQALELIARSQVQIYSMMFEESPNNPLSPQQSIYPSGQFLMNQIALASGGRSFRLYSDRSYSVDGLARVLFDEMHGQYSIGYYSTATLDGSWRDVEIRVKRPDATVQTRPGYYGDPAN